MIETPLRRVTFVRPGVRLWATTEQALSTKPGQRLTLLVHEDGYRELRVERSGREPILVNWLATVATHAIESVGTVKLAKTRATKAAAE